jgi:sec-independent protein translocase protein TatC
MAMSDDLQTSPQSATVDSEVTVTSSDIEEEAAEPTENGVTLIDHLQELRKRIFIAVTAVVIGASISWFYASNIIDFLIHPVGKMVFLSPGEAFFAYLKVSVFSGLMLALPVIMHQVWSFLVPALHEGEKKAVLILGPASVLLFIGGVAFSFYLVLPTAIKFFMGFATEQLQPLFSLGAYISFIISFLLPFGIVFELPLFLIVLAKLGIISSSFLASKRKIFLVLAFVIGAVAAPTPDVFSQVMVAIPLLLLYEISIITIKYVLKR